jgi:Ca2+-binding EF-hand superfamily protein
MTLQFAIRTFFRAAAACTVLATLSASPSSTQSNPGRFQGMDQNGDGTISRAEWRGSDQSFRRHDWNNDGVLSGEEVWAGGRRGWRRGGDNDYGSGQEPEISDWTAENFARLDRNRDDRISEQEWYYDWEAFRRIDRNRDGVVSRQEFLGEGATDDDDRDDKFEAIDADHNGRVTEREWHGSRETFQWLDRNRDGVLTRAEVVGEEQPARNLFDRLDLDRNGRITSNEWQWSKASFDQRDANGNGSLDRAELTRGAEPHTNAYQKGVERGLIDGRQAGREDKTRRNRWDLDGQRELEQADAGYAANMGARSEYQAGYRDGFTKGYREGFGPRS